MPHLRLDYSHNVTPDVTTAELFSRLHDLLADLGGIRRENCKSRAFVVDDFLVADGGAGEAGKDRGFVHLDVSFLEGRAAGTKRAIGLGARSLLAACFESAAGKVDLQITVELRDIERASYFKLPEGTLTPP